MHTVSSSRSRDRSKPCSSYRPLAIAFIELVERFSYYGTTVVFTNFIQQPLPDNSRTGAGGHDGQSGALGQGQQASTGEPGLMRSVHLTHPNRLKDSLHSTRSGVFQFVLCYL